MTMSHLLPPPMPMKGQMLTCQMTRSAVGAASMFATGWSVGVLDRPRHVPDGYCWCPVPRHAGQQTGKEWCCGQCLRQGPVSVLSDDFSYLTMLACLQCLLMAAWP